MAGSPDKTKGWSLSLEPGDGTVISAEGRIKALDLPFSS